MLQRWIKVNSIYIIIRMMLSESVTKALTTSMNYQVKMAVSPQTTRNRQSSRSFNIQCKTSMSKRRFRYSTMSYKITWSVKKMKWEKIIWWRNLSHNLAPTNKLKKMMDRVLMRNLTLEERMWSSKWNISNYKINTVIWKVKLLSFLMRSWDSNLKWKRMKILLSWNRIWVTLTCH